MGEWIVGKRTAGQALRVVVVLVTAAFRADRLHATLVVVLAPVGGAAAAVAAQGMREMVNAAARRDLSVAVVAVALLAGAAVGGYLASTASADMRIALQQRVGLLFDKRIIAICAGLPYLDHHEYPPLLDRLELLRAHRGELGSAFGSLVENMRALAAFASTLGLLVEVRPEFALLLLAAVPTVLATRRGERDTATAEQDVAGLARQRRALFALACAPEAAKELRVYGLPDEIAARHADLQARINEPLRRAGTRTALWTAAGWLVFGAGFAAALSVVVAAAARGRASAGDVVLTIALGSQLSASVSGVISMLSWLQRSIRIAGYYLWLTDHAATVSGNSSPSASADVEPGGDLLLEHVSFRYPGAEASVLEDVNLRLPAGCTVAIVGGNGAGKTTLVKLLSRMYPPTSGQISYAGGSLDGYDIAAWRSRLTACFQDFCKFEFVARESIGVGDVSRIGDDAALLAALAGAGARNLPQTLPRYLETQLGTSFPGGTDLSTGQWQKVALGRAGMRPEPVLRILDEPTASLDPASEYEVFARYQAIARQSRSITVLVSHRFGTVRMADQIVVLDRGRVREQGNHAQLMAEGGQYATLYNLHARGYAMPSTGTDIAEGTAHGHFATSTA